MATQTKMTGGGILRHYHEAAGRSRMIWHRAGTFHPEDPDAHEREESFTRPNWMASWSLTSQDRERLINEARDKAESNRTGHRTRSTYTSSASAAYNPEPEFNGDGDLVEVEAAATDATPALAEMSERIDNVEGLVITLNGDLANVQRTLEDVADFPELINRVDKLEQAAQRTVSYTVNNGVETRTTSGVRHMKFELLLKLATALGPADRNIWITGPAGSGKTSAAVHLADALGVDFEFQGALDTPYKLSGFLNASGAYVPAAFRRRYEHGGVILLDEVDGSAPGALLEINAALASTMASFPDGMVKRHADCYVLGAANTWGFGGDANYVGRNKLDAAFLDRWVTLAWPYDSSLEEHAAGNDEWVRIVQAVRNAAVVAGAPIVISPRASIKGAQLLAAGMSPPETVEAIFGRYRGISTWPTIGAVAERFASQTHLLGSTLTTPTKPGFKVDFSNTVVFGQR